MDPFDFLCLLLKEEDRFKDSDFTNFAPTGNTNEIMPESEKIVDRRMKNIANCVAIEVLVKWVGLLKEENWALYPHLVGNVF